MVPSGAVTTGLKLSTMLAWPGRSLRSASVSAGFSAWNKEPELYWMMSPASPVARRVLTMLSPSDPPGRFSISKVTSGFAAV